MYYLYLNTLKKAPVYFIKGFCMAAGARVANNIHTEEKPINGQNEQEKPPEQPSSNNKKPKN